MHRLWSRRGARGLLRHGSAWLFVDHYSESVQAALLDDRVVVNESDLNFVGSQPVSLSCVEEDILIVISDMSKGGGCAQRNMKLPRVSIRILDIRKIVSDFSPILEV